ncbi:solute carrier family 23 protein [Pararobbsia silviterrae]|uniref:Pyrimidine utilization transport protein G n=1 Tax=Pararobbsia silviterrae TaxID=1792498 RepID=A0A494YAY3_9BURK|nr:solute carrier family 23 protein [Pararobbsia silviterrae]RKP57805.1 pyrimidine utilization transport protein G [Pararobbsia silviterrae]
MSGHYFPRWTLSTHRHHDLPVAPDERLPWGQTVAMGLQHVVAMFGATVIAPLIMGFNPNVAILMSGIGTLIFFVAVGGRVPSYLGSSFAFIGAIVAVTGYAGHGANPSLPVALGGVIVCGLVYALIGAVVMLSGTRWIERLMPPVVTGAVVSVLGLNLAGVAVKGISHDTFNGVFALVTVVLITCFAVRARGLAQRLMLLLGVIVSYGIYVIATNGFGLGQPVDFAPVAAAAWIGWPRFAAPVFTSHAIGMMAPIAIILCAENLGHVKAVAAITDRNLDAYVGRAFLGDGIATMISGCVGGTGVTTYAENIGVMAVTKIYSSLVFVVAALVAILLGFSPKFGALILTIPSAIIGGVSVVVFGLIAVAGVRIWVNHQVDLTSNRNLIVGAVIFILGTGDFTLTLYGFSLGGIGCATLGGMLLHAIAQALGTRRASEFAHTSTALSQDTPHASH